MSPKKLVLLRTHYLGFEQEVRNQMSTQQHPAYHQGFYDAQSGEPIFDDCPSPEYRAGWAAFWRCKAILEPDRAVSFCGETDCTYTDGWCKCGMGG
jgi:hypothetical protein